MLVGTRPGEAPPDWLSIRVQTTELAGSFPFVEMKTRPRVVPAQTVPVSAALREITTTAPPARAGAGTEYAALVRSVAPAGPIWTKSPQPTWLEFVVNSGQLASRNA